ncbi:RELT-like protein 2 [Oryzias melastigma]|uniref:RELT-like protein 2 n=1 Tax=Oryzias melastigma TaxID=30732 RepID=A0A834CN26_ORYME|nr:RELT-like protein 2 [Oryzias melastigma]
MIFLVVFLFFLTGLLGFLICHMMKQKGYRCRTGDMEDEEEEEKLGVDADDEYEGNQDTVEQILKCIIENEANMEAFNELLGNHNVCVRHDPRLRKESIAGIPPHLHTVHSGTDLNSCHLCAQVRSKKGRRQSRTPRFKQRPGEQTVFSVGRFRVTHTDKKPLGGPTSLAASGDHLDQSQDSEDRKDAEYNIRSMFREARPPSEGINGAASGGRRKKSVSIFGLRRGSDPIGIKVKPGAGREMADFRFPVQRPPVVLEEPPQAENIGDESSTNPAPKVETEAVLAKTGLDKSPSIQREDYRSDTDPKECSKQETSQESHKIMTQSSTGNTVALAPSSLPILSERTVNVEKNLVQTQEICVPGPLQTSTPISPVPVSIAPIVPAPQPEHRSTKVFSISQSPPDLSSSSDVEPGFGAGLRFISLGSSPPSSTPNKTLSSVSLVKTPTSSLAESPSPKSNLRNLRPKAEKANFSTSLPSLPSGPERSDQEPDPSAGFVQNLSFMGSSQSESLTTVTIHSSSKDQQPEGDKISKTEGKMEIRRPGILKTSKYSGHSFPSDQASKERLSTATSSPSPTLSPSSPHGSRMSHVTIVKASPDSKREFSVVTMVEDREVASEQEDISASAGAESQSRETLESSETQKPEKDRVRDNNETETLDEREE